MNVVKCTGGHFYDADSYSLCPHCNSPAANTSAANNSVNNVKPKKKGLFAGLWQRSETKQKGNSMLQSYNKTPGVPTNNVPRSMPVNPSVNDNNMMENPTEAMPMPANNNTSEPQVSHTIDFWQQASTTESSSVSISSSDTSEQQMSNTVSESPAIEEPVSEFVFEPLSKPAYKSDPVPEPTSEQVSEPETENVQEEVSLSEVIKKASANNEGKTTSYFSAMNMSKTEKKSAAASSAPVESDPVVGWLVCIGGVHFGESFNIGAGKNSIGRNEKNRIVIGRDSSVSREKHSFVVYEPKKRNFYLQPGDGSGLTYLNDEYITDSKLLNNKDIIEIGNTKLMFVPLCGENFTWEDHMSKE